MDLDGRQVTAGKWVGDTILERQRDGMCISFLWGSQAFVCRYEARSWSYVDLDT